MLEILQLTSYSNDGSIHGGKIRAAKIEELLRRVSSKFERLDTGDLPFQQQNLPNEIKDLPKELIGDFHELYKKYEIWRRISASTNIIIFEQPWLWNEIKKIKLQYPEIKIIYSSQNIEFELKKNILSGYNGQASLWVCEQIRQIEIEIAREADYIICVSEHDSKSFLLWGSSSVVLAPNGVSRWERIESEEKNEDPYALIIGSAHPPNITGTFQYLSNPHLWLINNFKIKIIGSLGTALSYAWKDYSNVEIIAKASDSYLHEQIQKANVILLPISYGGGTNLKTSEALISGRPIVATKVAFRGLENYANGINIKITDNSMVFKQFVLSFMWKKANDVDRGLCEQLEWTSTLKPLKELILGVVDA